MADRMLADAGKDDQIELIGSGRVAPADYPAQNEPNINNTNLNERAKQVDFSKHQGLSKKEQIAIAKFESHDLSQLSNASLMDRVDTKFIVPRALLSSMLAKLQTEYTVLEINGQRTSLYENSYYDTPSFKHYMAHHNRRSNRFKLRKRTYCDSAIAFLEIKFKNNRGRTVKSRRSVAMDDSALNTNNQELMQESGLTSFDEHQVVQTSSYNRIALANEAAGERLTIDLNLHVHDTSTNKQFDIGDWAIVEIKQNVYDRDTTFFRWARSHGLRTCSFSKYCMGLYYTGPDALKRNNFHKINRHIESAARKFATIIAKPLTIY